MPTIDTEFGDEAEFVRHYVLTPTTLRNYDAKHGEGQIRGGVPTYAGDLSPMHLQASSATRVPIGGMSPFHLASTVTTLEGDYPSHVTFNVMHQHHHRQLPRPKKTRRYASATMLLAFVTLASFVYGAYQLNWVVPVGWALYTAPIPSDPTLPFMVLEAWPSCLDRRSDVWRLASYQFTHAGFFHCIMNQITLLTYGCLLEPQLQGKDPLGATTTLSERLMGSLTVFAAFQSAVVLGSLANAYSFGYSSLVGNSGGVYGLVGLGWACLATRRLSYMPEGRLEAVLLVTLVCQLVFDILSFTVFFNAAFGYLVHFSGFVAGFGLGLVATGLQAESCWWRLLFCVCGGALQVFQWSFLASSYVDTFPPAFHINPFFDQPYARHACCSDAYGLVSARVSLSQVRASYFCDAQQMLQPHPK